jgi:hypothetical protein
MKKKYIKPVLKFYGVRPSCIFAGSVREMRDSYNSGQPTYSKGIDSEDDDYE